MDTNKKGNSVLNTKMVFNKAFGQHILKTQEILDKIVDKSSIQQTDIVLEIGPGTGNLTQLLIEKAKKVIAIEIDDRMISFLQKRFRDIPKHKFEIIKGDAIKTEFPFFNVCVSNTPYQISSRLVFKLLSHRPIFKCAVLMFQSEFALRCVAKPGTEFYCRLSANVQLLAKADHLMKIGKGHFQPPPKVESSIIRLELKNPLPQIDFKQWDSLLRILFVRKNKTVRALLVQKNVRKLLEENYQKRQININTNSNNNNNSNKAPGDFNHLQCLVDEDEEQEQNGNSDKQMSKKQMRRMKKQQKTMQQQQDDNQMEDEQIEDEEMEEDVEDQFKMKISRILEQHGLKDCRTSKLSNDDFLKMLAIFNQQGIYFD